MLDGHHKTKQYLLASAKVLIVGLALGYIFYKLVYNNPLSFSAFADTLAVRMEVSGAWVVFFFILAIANWTLEILKWQTLVSSLEKISFNKALKQSLAALTVSLATPNRIGEYGAKAMFFEGAKRKKILLLQFFSSGSQLLVTVVFGMVGLLFLSKKFDLAYSVRTLCYLGIGLILVLAAGYYFKEKELLMKGFSVSKVLDFFRKIPFRLKRNALLFSFFRYGIFSGMFYGLLLFFGAELAISEAMPLIFAMYILVSIIPSVFIFDVVIRGSVAVWLFSLVGIPELVVLASVLASWILNFGFPAVWGSFFVVTFQPASR
jgi:hypothetical protein